MELTPDEIDSYMKKGYVIIPKVFSARESQDLSQATETLGNEIKQFEQQGLENQFEKDWFGSQIVLSKRPDAQGLAIKRIVWAAAACPLLTVIQQPSLSTKESINEPETTFHLK